MVKQIIDMAAGVIADLLQIGQSNRDQPDHLALSQLSMQRLFHTVAIEAGDRVLALLAGKQWLAAMRV